MGRAFVVEDILAWMKFRCWKVVRSGGYKLSDGSKIAVDRIYITVSKVSTIQL